MLLQTTCPSWALVMSFPSLFSLGFEECLIAPLGPILFTVLHSITMSRSLPPGTIPSSSNNTQNGSMLFLTTEPGDPLDNVKTTGYMLHTNLLGGLFIISKSARPKEQRENNWIHAPYQLAGRALHHLQICQAQGTIILPCWELAPWWPSVAALLPFCTCLTLGQTSDVLCFPHHDGIADLPHGTILALHFQELAWSLYSYFLNRNVNKSGPPRPQPGQPC